MGVALTFTAIFEATVEIKITNGFILDSHGRGVFMERIQKQQTLGPPVR